MDHVDIRQKIPWFRRKPESGLQEVLDPGLHRGDVVSETSMAYAIEHYLRPSMVCALYTLSESALPQGSVATLVKI